MIDKLISIQERDCAIRDIQKELSDIPARQKAEETRLNEHKSSIVAAEDALKSKLSAMKDLELEIESKNQKIAKLRQQQLEIKTNQEFKAIENEVHTLSHGVSDLEDKQLVLMDETDGARSYVADQKKALAQEEAAVNDDKAVLDVRAKELSGELQRMEAERQSAAKDIDPVWLERYDRILSRKDKAVVELVNGICGGCHMKLPPAVAHSAVAHTDMVFCDYCGRILY